MFSSNNNDSSSSSSSNPFQQLLQLSTSSSSSSSTMSEQSHSLSSPYLMMFDPEITNTNLNHLCSQYPYYPNNQLMTTTLPFLLPTYPFNNTYPHPPTPPPPPSVSCNYNANEMMMMMMMIGTSSSTSSTSNNISSTMTTAKKKKERHSKIETAAGVRDRRVRLSIGTSRKFFDLQDMLGFDKPSKTLDWLLSHSQPAILRLQQLQLQPQPTGDIMELENEDDDHDDEDDGDDQDQEPLLLNQHLLQERTKTTRTKDNRRTINQQQDQQPFGIGRVVSNSSSVFTTTTPPASTQLTSSRVEEDANVPSIPIFPHRHHHNTSASPWDINAATGSQLNGRFWGERDRK